MGGKMPVTCSTMSTRVVTTMMTSTPATTAQIDFFFILHILQGPHLRLPLELRPVDPVQLHELPREVEGFLFRTHLDQRVAAYDFLGLGEGSIRHLQLAAARANSQPLDGPLESGGVLENATLEPFGDELPHGVQQPLGDGLGTIAFGMFDEHQVFHDLASKVREGICLIGVTRRGRSPRSVAIRGRPHQDDDRGGPKSTASTAGGSIDHASRRETMNRSAVSPLLTPQEISPPYHR